MRRRHQRAQRAALSLALLIVSGAAIAGIQTDTQGIHAVPAPGKVTIDGDLSDWDRSGQVLMCYDVENLRDTYSAQVSLMYDSDALYVGIHWKDPVPLGNIHDPRYQANKGWAGDAVQLRLRTDRITHITGWYYAKGKEPALLLDYGKSLTEPFGGGTVQLYSSGGSKLEQGAEEGFRKDADGKGYVQELRLPWKLITNSGKAPATGTTFACGVDLLWGEADFPIHRYSDNLQPGATSREFFWTAYKAWGDVTVEPKGSLKLPTPAWEIALKASAAKTTVAQGPVPVPYDLPTSARVTLAIDDSKGKRVRNLLPAAPREKGENTELWDGMDDNGKPVSPGSYRVRGIYHQGIGTKYVMSFGSPGSPPWATPDGTGAFYADHTEPQAVAIGGEFIALACPMGEGGNHLIGCDKTGQRLWGLSNRVAFDGGHISLAADDKTLWVASEGKQSTIYRVALATGRYVSWNRTEKNTNGRDFQTLDLLVSDLPGVRADTAAGVNMTSIALHNGILAVCFARENCVKLMDAETAAIRRTISLPAPKAATFTPNGDLLVLSEGRLLKIAPGDTATPTPFTADGCKDGYGLTTDSAGNVYLSVRGADQNVRVFRPDGVRLRDIGRKGGRPVYGAFEPLAMRYPAQIAVDKENRLWVAEETMNPKRTSVWDSRTGKLLKDLSGTTTYAGAGSLNPDDPTMGFSDETVFKIDLNKGTWKPVYSLGAQNDPADIFPAGSVEAAPWTRERAGSHTRVMTKNGKTYLFSRDHCLLYDGKDWRSVSHIGTVLRNKDRGNSIYTSPLFDGHEGQLYAWADKNGDGLVQADELQFAAVTVAGKPAVLDSYYWGALPGPDGTVTYIARGTQTLLQFPVKGFTGCGAPIYDIASPKQIALPDGTINPGEGMVMTGADGTVILNQDPLTIIGKDGKILGTYPSRHISVHGSHKAGPSRPGYLIGPSSVLGTAETGSDVGEIFSMNGNLGENYLFTSDGFWVQALFKDIRGGFETPTKAVRGMSLDNGSANGESFGGNFVRAKDGRYYLTLGGTDARVIELTGLDTLRRLPETTITYTPAQFAEAQRLATERATQAQSLSAPKTYGIVRAIVAPVIDGKFTDWPELSGDGAVTISDGPSASYGTAAMRYDDKNLYIAWRVSAAPEGRMRNAGQDWHLLFKTGDVVDLMLGIDGTKDGIGDRRLLITQTGGKPVAVLNQKTLPAGGSKAESYGFSSPARTISFDRVALVPEVTAAVGPAAGGGYIVETAVPWATLGIIPTPGLKLRGDLGILLGDSGGTSTIARHYWSNKATGLVNDVPGEADLSPGAWGTFVLR